MSAAAGLSRLLVLRRALDSLLDITDRFKVFFQLPAVVDTDLALQVMCVGKHLVENRPIDSPPAGSAYEQVEDARWVDLLGRRFCVARPGNARAVEHRQAVFQPELGRFDAEDEAGDGCLVTEVFGEDLIHRLADADLLLVGADPGS